MTAIDFVDRPPVLVDVGASGSLDPRWRMIAPFSICLAFDADARDTDYLIEESSQYRKLIRCHRLVSERAGKTEQNFFLTKSPYCSSSLEPDLASIANWDFSDLFAVERVVKNKTTDVASVLKDHSIGYVDWFKVDSQGTDARIFRSLGGELIKRVLVSEFEPGFIPAYIGEDRMHDVLSLLEDHPFWLSQINVGGARRIRADWLNQMSDGNDRTRTTPGLRLSPCWAELTYINTFTDSVLHDHRNLVLGWIFSTIEEQYGFALELAQRGLSTLGDAVFRDMTDISQGQIQTARLDPQQQREVDLIDFYRRTEGRDLIVFGTGKAAERISRLLHRPPNYYVDNNAAMCGRRFNERPVRAPEALLEESADRIAVVVASIQFHAIQAQLIQIGLGSQTPVFDGCELFKVASTVIESLEIP